MALIFCSNWFIGIHFFDPLPFPFLLFFPVFPFFPFFPFFSNFPCLSSIPLPLPLQLSNAAIRPDQPSPNSSLFPQQDHADQNLVNTETGWEKKVSQKWEPLSFSMPNVELLELFAVKLRVLGTIVQKHESFLSRIKLIFLCDKIENFLSKFNIHSTNSSSADNWIFDHWKSIFLIVIELCSSWKSLKL